MMNSSRCPPLTREAQFDEKWAFVAKKEKHCNRKSPADRDLGDRWDHTAVDPERALLLTMVPGKRTVAKCCEVMEQVKARTGGRTDLLVTTDEHAPYETAVKAVYGVERPAPRKPGPGRPPKPRKVVPEDLCYATVRKTRKKGRVVAVVQKIVFGVATLLASLLSRSTASSTVNTSFVERHNGTDRGQNARKARKTYCFSKCVDVHDAASFFIAYSYNFCWAVRTLGDDAPCTPAMAAGFTDHVWSVAEWASYVASPG
jgi:IS1 family transposase